MSGWEDDYQREMKDVGTYCCKHRWGTYGKCLLPARFDGYCGNHKRMVEIIKLREANPALSYLAAGKLVKSYKREYVRKRLNGEAVNR